VQESVLDQVPKAINLAVEAALLFPVFLGRDHHFHAELSGRVDDGLNVVTLISQQIVSICTLDQSLSKLAIRDGT
jgi:hypothetical protein